MKILLLSISMTLAWDSDETDVQYKVKLGGQSGVYTTFLTTQAKTITIPLPRNTLYYAVVTAIRNNQESLPSNEIYFVTPKPGKKR